ncbi:MAG: O-antigen ligase family protein [Acholeplasma sp.]|nr:O-antigen ligase family protein [Acholeplasma sp.]
MKKIKLSLIGSLMLLMLIFPRQLQLAKAIILFAILLIVIIEISSGKRFKLNRHVLYFFFFYLVYAVYSSIVGLINNNPGVGPFAQLNILYYILLLPVVISISDTKDLMKMFNLLLLASLAISVHSILTLLVTLGYWPIFLYVPFDATNGIQIHEGYIHIVNTNTSMLIILVPISLLLIDKKVVSKKLLYFVIAISLTAILISGRRILWLSAGISILMVLLMSIRKNKKSIFALTLIGISVFVYFASEDLIDVKSIITRLTSAFIGEEGDIRYDQMRYLYSGFLSNPIFGSGAGIGTEYVRNQDYPWMYEASYHLILFNAGILGSLFFWTSIIFIFIGYFEGKFDLKMKYLATCILIIVLLANSTNPYFTSSFDFIIMILIPLMILNTSKINTIIINK